MQTLDRNPTKPKPENMTKPSNGVDFNSFKMPRLSISKDKILPAFWTVGAISSILLNLVLIAVLLFVGKEVFALKNLISDQLIGGLYYNFILMDRATIETTIQVDQTIPVQFDLHLNQNTNVVLTERTIINGAQVTLSTGGLNISQAPTSIVLPEGTVLPIKLDLIVPVDTTIPIQLTVPVSIPLRDTELHEPFLGLQEVVSPYYWLLNPLPNTWQELICQMPLGIGCP